MNPDEPWFPEPFGPLYEQPPGQPCPGCPCCTSRLCTEAARSGLPCSWHAQTGDEEIVANCPCSRISQ